MHSKNICKGKVKMHLILVSWVILKKVSEMLEKLQMIQYHNTALDKIDKEILEKKV